MKLKFAVSQEYLRPVTSHHGTFAVQSKPKQFPYFDVDISTDCSLCKVKILHLKYEAIPNSWEQCKEVVQEDESFMNYPFSPPFMFNVRILGETIIPDNNELAKLFFVPDQLASVNKHSYRLDFESD